MLAMHISYLQMIVIFLQISSAVMRSYRPVFTFGYSSPSCGWMCNYTLIHT